MESFLKEVLLAIKDTTDQISDLIFIVPSKRAGLFLKKELLEIEKERTFFAPTILSIEEFVVQLSGLQEIDNIQTLFEFYEVYLQTDTSIEKETFEAFSNWAQTLIYDFNEIDRYCIPHKSFFTYLSGIQDLNHWYWQKEKTELVKNYIHFWENVLEYYTKFKNRLLKKKMGYQGLLYRQASEDISTYIKTENRNHIFLGFNALNTAEQHIFQSLLEAGMATVFWDGDAFFFNNKYHEASLFLRTYKNQWEFYTEQPFKWIHDNFSKEKDIKLIGVAKNVGQAKSIGNILSSIPHSEMEKTALVLADETLLQPVLQALPNTVESLNITMGLPLREIPIAAFFEMLFNLHKTPSARGFYHKNILQILNSRPSTRLLGNVAIHISSMITKENRVYITQEGIQEHTPDHSKETIQLLFSLWKDVPTALRNCKKIIQHLKNSIDKEKNALELEYVYHFHLIFNKLEALYSDYPHLQSISSLHQLYKDILSTETLDFRGEPFSGLQLMGMLESRCLDFETVIISSVNEGVLPAGKSINSFIPYDLKRAYELPTYKEKDAIYTYHFYRLIQRAKKIYILYNTEDEGVGGGERSRFIRQLEIDKRPNHKITNYIVSSEVPAASKATLQIKKNAEIIAKLRELTEHGISPSALTTYIRNPIDFYYRYVLGIRETEEVEETIASNTLGTVIHNTLEVFYKPLEGTFLTVEALEEMISNIDPEVKNQFKNINYRINITQGKNLLIFEVAKKYIYNFLKSEQKLLETGAKLKILAIESNLKTQLKISELDFPIFIKGKVDRIDELNGQLRVIDYKSGKVLKNEVTLMDWNVITEDYKYSKAIQVLAYAYMYFDEKMIQDPFQAGIISFKNLKEGFLKFGTKESVRGKVIHDITPFVFDAYLEQLKTLIKEIFSMDIPFTEKEV